VLTRRAPQGGATLIEIVVALAILGILMAVVGPSAGVWLQNSQLRNAADAVLSGVQTARLEALKRNRPVSFRLTEVGSTAWQVCLFDPVADACSIAADAVLASKGAGEGGENARVGVDTALSDTAVALTEGAGLPASVTFDSFGRLSSATAANIMRVDVRNPSMPAADERRLVILISLGGQIRMCDPKLSQATNPQGCA
jgi:type IV fimbrial biogenesis protein FimT